jgi:plastocyanin
MNIRLIRQAVFLMALVSISQTTHAETIDVTVGNNFFSPNDITIAPGDTVRWTNAANRTHDTTADDFSWASETSSAYVFSHTFNDAGEVLYHCTVHSSPGQNINTRMNGRIMVSTQADEPDLVLDSVDAADGDYGPGDEISIDTMVSNIGTADSTAYSITFYASTDSTITSADTPMGTFNRAALTQGSSHVISDTATLPAGLSAGHYFIGAILTVTDSNPANNSAVDAVTIRVLVFQINRGINDAWFNSDTAGQGFFIIAFPDFGIVFLAWFTFETSLPDDTIIANLGWAGHRWFTAVGTFSGDTAVLDIEFTSGGIFDSVEPTPDQESGKGTITVKFSDCENATVTYDIPSIARMDVVPVTRGLPDNVALCNELNDQLQPPP